MKPGDRVTVLAIRSPYCGETGIVRAVEGSCLVVELEPCHEVLFVLHEVRPA